MHTAELRIETGSAETVRDITTECARFVGDTGVSDGLLHVWVPHATAGLALIETGAGSDADLLGGRCALGTWQSICLVDTNADNPVRTVRLSLLTSA